MDDGAGMRQRSALLIPGALALLGCHSNQCQLKPRYQHDTEGVGTAELTFTPSSKDHYNVRETGLGNFAGIATFSEGVLRIVFETRDGHSGTYTWDLDSTCTSGKGKLEFKTGGSGTHDSKLTAIE
jgi:hypothetical protein